MSWKDRSFYASPPLIDHRVGEDVVQFSQVSVGLLFKLKIFAVPLGKLIAALWQDTKRDGGSVNRSFASSDAPMTKNADGSQVAASDSEFIMEPIKDTLAKLRHDQRVSAITEFMEKVTDDKTLSALAEIAMDSMVNDFPKDKRGEWPPPSEFIMKTPMPVFIEMLIGVAKANKGRFGPLLTSAGIDGEALKNRARDMVAGTINPPKETLG